MIFRSSLFTLHSFLCVVLLCCTSSVHAQPRLVKQGSATQLEVSGKPMLIIGGELSNSATTSVADIDDVMPRMKALGLNTVLAPICWDLFEPVEGEYDFTLVDRTIQQARQNNLKVVFLWFGAWKNSMSCYAPLWLKENVKKYPRCLTRSGKPLEIASPFSTEVLQADKRAFARLMQRIADTDREAQTVIMVQIENEIGMLEDARDHSPVANKLFADAVPDELVDYLKANKRTLHPWLKQKLDGQASLRRGNNWSVTFGDDIYTDEIFMAYHFAKYVEQLAQTARSIYNLPLYVNAAMNSRGRKPGEYPSAGPLAHLIDIWHCGAPSIDLLAPDLYDDGFKDWVAQYHLPNNPLFIPECRLNDETAAKALYVFGEHDAIGFCPFSVDNTSESYTSRLSQSYALLHQLSPLLLKYQGEGRTHGLLLNQQEPRRVIRENGMEITASHVFTLGWDPRSKSDAPWPHAGGILLRLADDEYLVAGAGVVLTFATDEERAFVSQQKLGEDGFAEKGVGDTAQSKTSRFKGQRVGLGFVDQVAVDAQGHLSYVRRDNGDQNHQGRHVRIEMDDWRILHIKLYRY
ncbi:MAG: DUF5597 domain-containing protein [Bacteroidaceae bacterium]|nr:DUF5597 domain-containing protein [Bacteroidaceae bacterium]